MDKLPKLSIPKWANDDKPREKILLKGIESLSDAELIAILIGSGNKDETAVDLAKRILSNYSNNLNEIGKLAINDLKKFKGIGIAKGITIMAALELGKRRSANQIIERQSINSSNDVYLLFHPLLCDSSVEEFWVLLLNRANRIIDKIRLSQGGISGTVTDVRLILKEAILRNSTSLIICHNHPSGNVLPSENDKNITIKVKESAKLMDIQLLDHVIITDGKFFSFADENLI